MIKVKEVCFVCPSISLRSELRISTISLGFLASNDAKANFLSRPLKDSEWRISGAPESQSDG